MVNRRLSLHQSSSGSEAVFPEQRDNRGQTQSHTPQQDPHRQESVQLSLGTPSRALFRQARTPSTLNSPFQPCCTWSCAQRSVSTSTRLFLRVFSTHRSSLQPQGPAILEPLEISPEVPFIIISANCWGCKVAQISEESPPNFNYRKISETLVTFQPALLIMSCKVNLVVDNLHIFQ